MKPIKVTDHKYKDEHRDNNNEKKKTRFTTKTPFHGLGQENKAK